MRSHTPTSSTSKSSPTPSQLGLLQRKCDCGNSANLTGKCSKCDHDRLTLQRQATHDTEPSEVPPIVHEVFNSPRALERGLSPRSLKKSAIQTKLKINEPGDRYEQEADRIADEVMRMLEPSVQRQIRPATQVEMIQRKPTIIPTPSNSDQSSSEVPFIAYESVNKLQQGRDRIIQRVVTDHSEKEISTHADVLSKQSSSSKGTPNKCRTVKTQRWGCDTACSRAGFRDNETPFTDAGGEFGKSECCNKWPPFVESFARDHLSLNGVASCKGSMFLNIFKVKSNGKEIRIGCTDSTTTDADHELELSPLAAIDLFGKFTFPKNKQVQVCPDGALPASSVCRIEDPKKMNNPNNPAFPRQFDCLEKGCVPQDPYYDCDRYGWPRV